MKQSKSEYEQLDALLGDVEQQRASTSHSGDAHAGDARQRPHAQPALRPPGGPGLVRPSTSEYEIAALAKAEEPPAASAPALAPAISASAAAAAAAGAAAAAARRRFVSLLCVLAITLLGDSARGLFLPTQLQYVTSLGGGEGSLGLAVASYSAGRLLFSPALGTLADRRTFAFSLQVSLALMVAGNAVYILVPRLWAMLAARFLVGCGASTLGISRAYVVAVTSVEQRTAYMAYLSAVQFAGFAVMPGLGAALASLPELGVGPLRLDAVTAPAWLLVACSCALAALLARSFDEPAASKADHITGGGLDDLGRLPVLPLAVCLAINFVFRGVLAIVETIGTVITSHYFHLQATGSGLLFAAVGVFGMAVFLSIRRLSARFGDAALVLSGLIASAGGFALLACLSERAPHMGLFLAGLALVWTVGYPLGQTAILSLFSKLLGRRKQGAWMGWFTSSGALARVACASLAGWLYPLAGLPGLAGATAALILASAAGELAIHRSLRSLTVRPAPAPAPAGGELQPSVVVTRGPSAARSAP